MVDAIRQVGLAVGRLVGGELAVGDGLVEPFARLRYERFDERLHFDVLLARDGRERLAAFELRPQVVDAQAEHARRGLEVGAVTTRSGSGGLRLGGLVRALRVRDSRDPEPGGGRERGGADHCGPALDR